MKRDPPKESSLFYSRFFLAPKKYVIFFLIPTPYLVTFFPTIFHMFLDQSDARVVWNFGKFSAPAPLRQGINTVIRDPSRRGRDTSLPLWRSPYHCIYSLVPRISTIQPFVPRSASAPLSLHHHTKLLCTTVEDTKECCCILVE